MSKTNIEWSQHVWNPIAGCSIVSPGCTNCYAMKMAYRLECSNAEAAAKYQPERVPHYNGTTKRVNGNAVWTGRVARSEKALGIPLRRKVPTTWFVNSMSDLFHESVPDEWIDEVFAVMALTPQHTYQVLTKRSARMRAYMTSARERIVRRTADGNENVGIHTTKIYRSTTKVGGAFEWPLPNVWLGVSTERQKEADERIPDLLATPAAVRFISAEPLLGPIDLATAMSTPAALQVLFEKQAAGTLKDDRGSLHWVITGGESGPGARPMAVEWVGSIVEQCRSAGVACFVKQLSGQNGRAIKDISLFPADLRIREYPRAA